MYTVYFIFFQVASATATNFGLSRGLLGLQYDQINASESESESVSHPPCSIIDVKPRVSEPTRSSRVMELGFITM